MHDNLYMSILIVLFNLIIMYETNKLVLTIRSGGQTGVDRAALDAALRYNTTNLPSFDNNAKRSFHVHVTGWCPLGRLAEDGQISSRYPLIETPTSLYSERTEWN